MAFEKQNSSFQKDLQGSGTTFILREMIAKLKFSAGHLEFLKHECNDCVGVKNINWCISNLNEFSSLNSIKLLQVENEDKDLEKMLNSYLEEDKISGEVAQHISTNFRMRKNTYDANTSPKDAFRRRSLRVQGKFNEPRAESISSLLSVVKKPKKSHAWLMDTLDEWSCDIFKVAEFTTKPLTTITYALMEKRDFMSTLKIESKHLVSFVHEVEQNYHPNNSYHNNIHAADVIQTMHYLLLATPLAEALSDLEIFSLLIASAIHDVDHPGFNNTYLVKVKSNLATLYNDASVLENHHLAVAFKILYAKKHNFLTYLSDQDANHFRSLVIKLVLATDSNYHVSVTSGFQVCIAKCLVGNEFIFDTNESRIDLMRGLMHFADISNPAKALDVYLNWTRRIMEEFFTQGDLERESNMTVSPLCDRHRTDIGQGQLGFIDYIVRPVCDVIVKILSTGNDGEMDKGKMLQDHVQENYEYFKYKYNKSDSFNKDMEMANKNEKMANLEKDIHNIENELVSSEEEMINKEKGMRNRKDVNDNKQKEMINKKGQIVNTYEENDVGNFSENAIKNIARNNMTRVHYANTSRAMDMKTPVFYKVSKRSCLQWNADTSDNECD